MKVFISWSGKLSRECAVILYNWLPTVLQNARPYMSSKNIEKGERWSIDLASELADTNYGIICVAPDNIAAPWIMFESGALSKSLASSRVSPILFALSPSDLAASPLLQFQATLFGREEILSLLKSINSFASSTEQISSDILEKAFQRAWPELENEVAQVMQRNSIKDLVASETIPIQQQDIQPILEEILSNTRQQIKLLRLREIETQTASQIPVPFNSEYWSEVDVALQTLNSLIAESHDVDEHTKLAKDGAQCIMKIDGALKMIRRSLYGVKQQA